MSGSFILLGVEGENRHVSLEISMYQYVYKLQSFHHDFLGVAFELGRHELLALRRLITIPRSSAFTGGYEFRMP